MVLRRFVLAALTCVMMALASATAPAPAATHQVVASGGSTTEGDSSWGGSCTTCHMTLVS